jgi:hypothetical protein
LSGLCGEVIDNTFVSWTMTVYPESEFPETSGRTRFAPDFLQVTDYGICGWLSE